MKSLGNIDMKRYKFISVFWLVAVFISCISPTEIPTRFPLTPTSTNSRTATPTIESTVSPTPVIVSITNPEGYNDYIKYIGKDPADPSFEQIVYQWGNIEITVTTNAGVYSKHLNDKHSQLNNDSEEIKSLIGIIQSHFMITGALPHTFENSAKFMLPEVISKVGLGHSLPIIWAVAIENITRPLPALFGDQTSAHIWNLDEAEGGMIDPNKPGKLKIVVDTNLETFVQNAKEMGYSFSQSYYIPALNEIRIYLDIEKYSKYYGYLEQESEREYLLPLGFISYTSSTFNDNSGHEIAHFFQNHSGDLAYQIPFISEGEALVQGFTRRRQGLIQQLLYGQSEFMNESGFDREKFSAVIPERVKGYMEIGMSFSPFEMDRIVELRKWYKEQTLIPVKDLLKTDWKGFYSGSQEEIKKRYLQSWLICLFAIRSEEIEGNLRIVVDAALNQEEIPEKPLSFLEGVYDYYLKDYPPATSELWIEAEEMYKKDKKLAGLLYQQVYVNDPNDYMSLIFLGDILYDDGFYDSAYYYYRKSQLIAPDNLVPLARIGDVYFATGNFLDAQNAYKEALSIPSTSEYEDFLVEWISSTLNKMQSTKPEQ